MWRVRKAVQTLRYLRALVADHRSAIASFNHLTHLGIAAHPSIRLTGELRDLDRLTSGCGVQIEGGTTIWLSPDSPKGKLRFGDHVYVGKHVYLGVGGDLSIGSNTIIGAFSYIISAEHRFDDARIPVRDQGFKQAGITIESNVWVGTHVVIRDGVTIGADSIIGAGAVVICDVPASQIWAGVPARCLRDRSSPRTCA